MATLKKSARKKAATADKEELKAQAEHFSKSLSDSAQQVWLAGVGAFARAQTEGTKIFETLVKEGLALEQTTRKVAGKQVDAVRGAVEHKVGQARERASDTWDRLEKVFEDRVQRALRRLEVPSRDDLGALVERVDVLNAELRKLGGTPITRPRKSAAKKAPPSKTAAKKAPARKAAARKATPAKKSSKKNP